jgi:hypothetical protein
MRVAFLAALVRLVESENTSLFEGETDRVGALLKYSVCLGGAESATFQDAGCELTVQASDQATLGVDHDIHCEGDVELLARHRSEQQRARNAAPLSQEPAARSRGDGEPFTLERLCDDADGCVLLAGNKEVVA